MTPTNRPAQIITIMKTVLTTLPVDMGMALEAYIAGLEGGQQAVPPGKTAPSHNTSWLYWHGVKRAQERQKRALRK
jgi:hypothetical protein